MDFLLALKSVCSNVNEIKGKMLAVGDGDVLEKGTN